MRKILVISGGNSVMSRVNGLVMYIAQQLAEADFAHHIIQVHQLPAQDLLTADHSTMAIQQAIHQVEQADAIIIVTPIFKASYSGILKTFLDVLPQKGLRDKLVYTVGLGGSSNHVLALQYALDPVLKELGADYILKGTMVIDSQVTKTFEGQFALDDDVVDRIDMKLEILLDKLIQPIPTY